MEDYKIRFSILWIACMLIYLLGDVIRIFAGEFTPGEIDGNPVDPNMYLLMAVLMVIPIAMVLLSLILKLQVNSWVNIIIAIGFLAFNLAGIAGYKGFDIFLLCVSFVINGLTIYYASYLLRRDFRSRKAVKE